jgi:hypothetical protein
VKRGSAASRVSFFFPGRLCGIAKSPDNTDHFAGQPGAFYDARAFSAMCGNAWK